MVKQIVNFIFNQAPQSCWSSKRMGIDHLMFLKRSESHLSLRQRNRRRGSSLLRSSLGGSVKIRIRQCEAHASASIERDDSGSRVHSQASVTVGTAEWDQLLDGMWTGGASLQGS